MVTATQPMPAVHGYKMGKHPVRHDPRTLQFGAYLKQGLAPPPPSKSWTANISAKSWGMMKNDEYGDCTCAAAGHMIMEWSANTGNEVVIPDLDIVKFYNYFAEGNPDAGANMLDVLKRWHKTGIDKHKVIAFTALELKNDVQVKDAVNLFGACYIGVALPNFAVAEGKDWLSIAWVVPPKGPVGNAAPNEDNGHCIPAVGYDERNVYVVTWGQLKSMSWQFYNAYAEEAYAVIGQDWFSKKLGSKAPSGFDLATLQQDLHAIAG